MTENHGYNMPDKGAQNWGESLNENFERLDRDVEIRDTSENLNEYSPRPGSKFLATDTGEVFVGDGDGWNRIETTGTEPTVQQQSIGEARHISEGPALGEQISEAIKNGYKTIYIHGHVDNSPWSWGSDVTLNAIDHGGIEIVVDRNTVIEYDGDGVPLTVDNTWDVVESTNAPFKIVGGLWRSTGETEGWLQINDAYGSYIHPQEVTFHNSAGDCVAVELRNVDGFCEDTYVSGRYATDIGLRTTPASITGGSGTDSFHDTHIAYAWMSTDTVGFHLRGNWANSTFVQPTWQPSDDGSVGFKFETSMCEGLTILSPKLEDASNTQTGCVGFQTTENFEGQFTPLVVNERITYIDTPVDFHDNFRHSFPSIRAYQNRFQIAEPGGSGSLNWYPRDSQLVGSDIDIKTWSGRMTLDGADGVDIKNDGNSFIKAIHDKLFVSVPTTFKPMDVTAFKGTQTGVVAYHNGDDDNPEGLAECRSDGRWYNLASGEQLS